MCIASFTLNYRVIFILEDVERSTRNKAGSNLDNARFRERKAVDVECRKE